MNIPLWAFINSEQQNFNQLFSDIFPMTLKDSRQVAVNFSVNQHVGGTVTYTLPLAWVIIECKAGESN